MIKLYEKPIPSVDLESLQEMYSGGGYNVSTKAVDCQALFGL